MKIERFEDIQAWQEGRNLTNSIYEACKLNLFYNMANIAEGFDSQSNLEFIKFLVYGRRSCSEVQSHLYVALDRQYITKERFSEIYKQAVKVKELIGGFIRYLRNSKRRT